MTDARTNATDIVKVAAPHFSLHNSTVLYPSHVSGAGAPVVVSALTFTEVREVFAEVLEVTVEVAPVGAAVEEAAEVGAAVGPQHSLHLASSALMDGRHTAKTQSIRMTFIFVVLRR